MQFNVRLFYMETVFNVVVTGLQLLQCFGGAVIIGLAIDDCSGILGDIVDLMRSVCSENILQPDIRLHDVRGLSLLSRDLRLDHIHGKLCSGRGGGRCDVQLIYRGFQTVLHDDLIADSVAAGLQPNPLCHGIIAILCHIRRAAANTGDLIVGPRLMIQGIFAAVGKAGFCGLDAIFTTGMNGRVPDVDRLNTADLVTAQNLRFIIRRNGKAEVVDTGNLGGEGITAHDFCLSGHIQCQVFDISTAQLIPHLIDGIQRVVVNISRARSADGQNGVAVLVEVGSIGHKRTVEGNSGCDIRIPHTHIQRRIVVHHEQSAKGCRSCTARTGRNRHRELIHAGGVINSRKRYALLGAGRKRDSEILFTGVNICQRDKAPRKVHIAKPPLRATQCFDRHRKGDTGKGPVEQQALRRAVQRNAVAVGNTAQRNGVNIGSSRGIPEGDIAFNAAVGAVRSTLCLRRQIIIGTFKADGDLAVPRV